MIELIKYASSHQLYEDLVLQLKKDFGLANLTFDLPADCNPDELKYLLQKNIQFLIEEKFSDFLNLLYIVDLPETYGEKNFRTSEKQNISDHYTFLILKRVWQKVWFRQTVQIEEVENANLKIHSYKRDPGIGINTSVIMQHVILYTKSNIPGTVSYSQIKRCGPVIFIHQQGSGTIICTNS